MYPTTVRPPCSTASSTADSTSTGWAPRACAARAGRSTRVICRTSSRSLGAGSAAGGGPGGGGQQVRGGSDELGHQLPLRDLQPAVAPQRDLQQAGGTPPRERLAVRDLSAVDVPGQQRLLRPAERWLLTGPADRLPAQVRQGGAQVTALVAAAGAVGVEEHQSRGAGTTRPGRPGTQPCPSTSVEVAGARDASRSSNPAIRSAVTGSQRRAAGSSAVSEASWSEEDHPRRRHVLSMEVRQQSTELVCQAQPSGDRFGRRCEHGRDRPAGDRLPDQGVLLRPDRHEGRDQQRPVLTRTGERLLDPRRLREPLGGQDLGVDGRPGRARPEVVAEHATRAGAVAHRLDPAATHRPVGLLGEQTGHLVGVGDACESRQAGILPVVVPGPAVRRARRRPRTGTGASAGRSRTTSRHPSPGVQPRSWISQGRSVQPGGNARGSSRSAGSSSARKTDGASRKAERDIRHLARQRSISTASPTPARTCAPHPASWTGQRRAVSFSWNSAANRRARAHRASSQGP